ncbi:hypothetical protein LPJ61_005161 [Coemansia biformis]|uniref:SURP motif domain-containing protein n=1 Tax=Coemansia biformis TaxID=1286918 RepID=A0A9W7YAF6_9FUNG|nr:hypothetical protein LPJ61_005161 [Coemansia biformis]
MGTRAAMQRQRSQRPKRGPEPADNESEQSRWQLIAFGYSARIFAAPDEPRGDGGLVELDAGSGAPLWVDRYDIRHLLSQPLGAGDCASATATLSEPELNPARFAALADADIPEHEVFRMDPEERRAYIAGIGQPKDSLGSGILESGSHDGGSQDHASQDGTSQKEHATVALRYDSEGVPKTPPASADGGQAVDAGGFEPPFAAPDGMAVPATRRHFEIVEHTARFIAEQPADRAGQVEAMIQGKQGTNADFGFLNRASPLHSFYQHILWLMRTGLYAYGEDSPSPGPGSGRALPAPPSAHQAPQDPKPPPAPPDTEAQSLQAKRRRLAAEFLRRKRGEA